MAEEVEEGQIREVRQAGATDEGQSVVRIKKERKHWPFFVLLLVAIVLLVALLRPSEKESDRVSLPAARELLLQKNPPWQKPPMLRALREGGFRATPGPPRSPLQITVTLRRDGLLLRSQTGRLRVLKSDFKKP